MKIIHTTQAEQPVDDGFCCDCHRVMGNEFYFLPIDQCIHRDDGICNKRPKPVAAPKGEKA